MRQDSHRWDVVHAVRRYMAPLVTVELVEGGGTPRRVTGPLASLISDPRRNGGLLLQPVAQRCGGKLALVPVRYRGEEGEGAAEEPREVHLRWILRCCIYSDIKVRDLVQRRGDHIDGRGAGQAAASRDRGIQVVYAIPRVASLLVSTEGPHRRLEVRH